MIRLLIVAIAMSSVMSGCLLRWRTVEKPRTDMDVKGNAGCLQGDCKKEPKKSKLSDKRLISVLELEIGKSKKKLAKEKEALAKRRQQVADYKSNLGKSVDVTEVSVSEDEEIVFDDSIVQQEELVDGPQIYVVQKGDTLQKISKKFYGTTKKYIYLYENNRDILKSKDSLRVGQKLTIPEK